MVNILGHIPLTKQGETTNTSLCKKEMPEPKVCDNIVEN